MPGDPSSAASPSATASGLGLAAVVLLGIACAGSTAPTVEPQAPTLAAGGAEGSLPGERAMLGAVRFEDLDQEGQLTLVLTSWAEQDCGLVDWGDSRTDEWSFVTLPAVSGGEETLRLYEGSPMAEETWGLRAAQTLRGRVELQEQGLSGTVHAGEAQVRFHARDCGEGRL